ncbi:MAG: Crp/Fnr family transcriptional regulator [Saprospiraceae bacterium]|nr:Crp/Fnr family transcriptional regulator [Saprospiraceae bacterium]
MHDLLIAHLRETIQLADQDIPLVEQAFKVKKLKKRDLLLQAGDPSNHMRFISEGCLRVYYLDTEAREHILQFGIEGWWVNDLYSYLTQTPAQYYIQAVEDSTVLQVHRDALEQLFVQAPVIERFFRRKIQKAYVALQERTIKGISDSAEKRYLAFQKQYRALEQRLPQYMIASYLGVTPEHLSAIRKKMAEQRGS